MRTSTKHALVIGSFVAQPFAFAIDETKRLSRKAKRAYINRLGYFDETVEYVEEEF